MLRIFSRLRNFHTNKSYEFEISKDFRNEEYEREKDFRRYNEEYEREKDFRRYNDEYEREKMKNPDEKKRERIYLFHRVV